MRRIIGAAFVSLDGVMQAPGALNEDPSGGFDKGGWLADHFDEAAGEAVSDLFSRPFDLLLGRRTYDIFAAFWPFAEGESKAMGEMFDRVGKYVVTRGQRPLTWENSHRVGSLDEIAELKRGDGPDLVIQGSSLLYPQLLARGLLDRLTLMTFPVVLGAGKRLFGEGTPSGAMRVIEQKVSPAGTVIASYAPAGEIKLGSIAEQKPSEAEIARREAIAEGVW